MRMKVLFLAAAATCLALGAFFINDLNRVAVFDGSGQISSGKLANIEVGQQQDVASKYLLDRGMISGVYKDDGSCPIQGKFDNILVFVDLSWRKGTICLGVVKSKIATVAWRYNLFQP